jgi:hypothetical protein
VDEYTAKTAYIYVNAKMIPVETISRMGCGRIKETGRGR